MSQDHEAPDGTAGEEDLDLNAVILVESFSAMAGAVVAVDDDGDEVQMVGVVLAIEGALGDERVTHRFVLPAAGWEDLNTCGVKAILAYETGGALDQAMGDARETSEEDAAAERRWTGFAARLATALDMLDPHEFLVLENDIGRFVQVAMQEDEIRAETVSNQYLGPDVAVSPGDLDLLAELGWSPPTHFADQDDSRDQGSPNHWIDLPDGTPADRISSLLITTLRRIHQVVEPEDLTYVSSDDAGARIILPTLGLSRSKR